VRNGDFLELLGELQDLIDKDVNVRVLFGHRFFGADFHARLERVETIPAGDAVRLEFANGVCFDVAPGEQLIISLENGLELRVGPELVLLLTADTESDDGARRSP
jgi:hypothetical protein